ncbi:putative prophage protein [Escherichia coli]|nr:putative prophage protein [Escherichia coli]
MTSKNSGLTASGKAQPEFMRGDIYRDKYGGIVTNYQRERTPYRLPAVKAMTMTA